MEKAFQQAQKQPKSRFCPSKRLTYATAKAKFGHKPGSPYCPAQTELADKENTPNKAENQTKSNFFSGHCFL